MSYPGYLIKDTMFPYGCWVFSLLMFGFIGFGFQNILLVYGFIVDFIGGFIVAGLFLLNSSYKEYRRFFKPHKKG
jgi:hypothetical protein